MNPEPALNPKFNFQQIGIGNISPLKLTNHVKDLLETTNDENLAKGDFPYHVFPTKVQEIVLSTNRDLNFPIDFIGASILYASSVAIGNSTKVQIKSNFLESAVVYLAIVAKAGTNKSQPLSFALQPVFDHDKRSYAHYEEQCREYEKYLNLPKKEKDKIELQVKPIWKKHLLSDYTPEALAEVHKFNKRGIGVYSDELAAWFKNFNRYNKGSEMEFWLSAWSGKPINIDRKSGEPIYIPTPFISIAGTIQNGILHELAKESRTENGFIDRILFVIPDNLLKPYWSETEICPEIIEDWKQIITNLLNIPVQLDETLNPVPAIVNFSLEAKEILFAWQIKNADECNSAQSEMISGIYSKLEMYVARIALILQLMKWACNEEDKNEISVDTIKGAIQLIEYFKISAIKVYSIISNVSPLSKFPNDKQKLYEMLPDIFTTDMGLSIASDFGMPVRTFKRFLTEKELFNKISRGEYEKRV